MQKVSLFDRRAKGFAALVIGMLSAAGMASASDRVDFSRDIRPVLSENCFHCHGPDASHRKADVRLDEEKTALEVIMRGQSGKSLLIERITADDLDERMPPPASRKELTPAQIGLLRRWIDEGAPWGKHWAFTRLERPAVPRPHAPGFVTGHPSMCLLRNGWHGSNCRLRRRPSAQR